MKPTRAEKAIELARRYARICRRITDARNASARLYAACEQQEGGGTDGSEYPWIAEPVTTCVDRHMGELAEWRRNGWKDGDPQPERPEVIGCVARFFRLPTGPDGERPLAVPFCHHCALGWKLTRHRKRTLTKRRAGVLAAIRRLGAAA